MFRFLMPLVTAGAVVVGLGGDQPAAGDGPALSLHLRSRVQPFKGDPAWQAVEFTQRVPAARSAIVVCDMWDDHWCKLAAQRCEALAKKMAPVLAAARDAGVIVIHAPSDCMTFYEGTPARKRAQVVPRAAPPKLRELPDPPCEVDASDGGCDDPQPAKEHRAWTRQ